MANAPVTPIHDGRYCGAKKKQGEGCCMQAAGWGTDHPGVGRCKLHGGCAPSSRVAAVEQQARRELARLNVAPVADPLSALAQIAGEVLAWKDTIAGKVNELTSLRYSTEGGEQLRSEVALFERALDRCEKFLTAMARLNIDERLVTIERAKADIVIAAVEAALARAGVTGQAAIEAKREAARHLRAV